MSTNKPPVWRFLGGSLAGFLAGHILNFGIVQFVLARLDAPAFAGFALFIAFGTPVVLGFHAGAICDRIASISVARRLQWGYAIGAAILIGLDTFPELDPRLFKLGILAAALSIGIAWSYVSPARLVYLAQLVPPDDLRPKTIIFNVCTTVGFGLAPLMIGLASPSIGWSGTFAISIGLVLLAELAFAAVPTIPPAGESEESQHWIRATLDGMRYIKEKPILWQLLSMTLVVHILLGPIQVILPPLATEQWGLGATSRGAFISMLAPLLIAGGMIALRIRSSPREGWWLIGASLSSGAAMLALGFAHSTAPAIVLFALFGLLGGTTVALLAAMLQLHSDPQKRGRVMSLYSISTQFFPAFGGLLSGIAMRFYSTQQALWIVAGTVVAILALLLPFFGAIRRNQ